MEIVRDDYQQFTLDDGRVTKVQGRMLEKLEAIPLPDVKGKTVLDVGCDMGFWSFVCSERGADVLGLDRGRLVKSQFVDLAELNENTARTFPLHDHCRFKPLNLGMQWKQFGARDVVLMFSMYHHVYALCADHRPIWFWLWLHTKEQLIWEGPVDEQDRVVQMNVPVPGYEKDRIFEAASRYFDCERIGDAIHEPHRHVYRCIPKTLERAGYRGEVVSGAGGASKAWQYNYNRRQHEFARATGMVVHPGSLNVNLESPFDWSRDYFRFPMLDVCERGAGLDVKWEERWARAYPVNVNGKPAYVFRFEGESYPETFVEIVSADWLDRGTVEIT